MKKFLTALTTIILLLQFSGEVFATILIDHKNNQGLSCYTSGDTRFFVLSLNEWFDKEELTYRDVNGYVYNFDLQINRWRSTRIIALTTGFINFKASYKNEKDHYGYELLFSIDRKTLEMQQYTESFSGQRINKDIYQCRLISVPDLKIRADNWYKSLILENQL